MKDDIIINKTETIKRCIKRVEEEYEGNSENLKIYRRQDSIILNIQRLCEACLDIAIHFIRLKKYEVPQTSKEAFEVLENHGIIPKELSHNLQGMVGFRNIAVHDYQKLNLKVVQAVVEKHLHDGLKLAKCVLESD